MLNKNKVKASLNYLIRHNFLIFLKYVLKLELGQHHFEWWANLRTGEDCVFLSPRDHGKSVCIARAYPLWKAIYHNEVVHEILILGADAAFAQMNLAKLKELARSNPILQSFIPPENSRRYRNTRSELELTNGVFIYAKGYLSPLRGRHPQILVMDDICNEKNSLTEESRDKTKKFFYGVVYPMKDQGMASTRARGIRSQIVSIGTAQHYKDLNHELLSNSGFRGKKQKAIIDDLTKTVLWPERYPYEELQKRRKTMGRLMFAQEFQNEPIQDSTVLFPPDLFKPLLDETLSYVYAYSGSYPVYLGCDFNVPGDTAEDYTIVASAAYNTSLQTFTLLNYDRFQAKTMNEQTRKIEIACDAFKVTSGFVESNLFQKIYANYFANTKYPIKGHVVSSTKNYVDTGILSLRPVFEQCRFKLPYKTQSDREKTDLLISEFGGLIRHNGKIKSLTGHDDIPMAVWHMYAASGNNHFSYEFIGDQQKSDTSTVDMSNGELVDLETLVLNDIMRHEVKGGLPIFG